MSILSRIAALFTRAPRQHTSAYAPLYSAVAARLIRAGVWIGGTAGYPRVEIHSITESERLDKEGRLHQLTLIVDSISNVSLDEAVTMNDDNLTLLTGSELTVDGWDVIGIVPTLLQDLTETSDSQAILYRLTQQFTVFICQQDAAEDPAAEDASEETPKNNV